MSIEITDVTTTNKKKKKKEKKKKKKEQNPSKSFQVLLTIATGEIIFCMVL